MRIGGNPRGYMIEIKQGAHKPLTSAQLDSALVQPRVLSRNSEMTKVELRRMQPGVSPRPGPRPQSGNMYMYVYRDQRARYQRWQQNSDSVFAVFVDSNLQLFR